MTRRYARSCRGIRTYNHAPYQRGQNLTIIGAMALKGLVGEITFPGATDALAFKTYVTQILVPILLARRSHIFSATVCSYPKYWD